MPLAPQSRRSPCFSNRSTHTVSCQLPSHTKTHSRKSPLIVVNSNGNSVIRLRISALASAPFWANGMDSSYVRHPERDKMLSSSQSQKITCTSLHETPVPKLSRHFLG